MSKIKLDELISILRDNYSKNKAYYENLFSILYFTDEDFIKENFLKNRNIFHKQTTKRTVKVFDIIPHDKYVYTMNVFKNIFGKEFIKSKPLLFLDAFIVCCGDKAINNSTDVKKILRKKLLTDFDTQELYKKFECRNRSGFTRKKVRALFENYNKQLEQEDNPLLIRYLCDYFNMNICIILPEEKDIIFYSPRDKFSIYYPTMVLEKHKDNQYQYLIMTNKETVFTSSASFVYKLLEYKISKDFMEYVRNQKTTVKKINTKTVNSHFIQKKEKEPIYEKSLSSKVENIQKKEKEPIYEKSLSSKVENIQKYNKTVLNKTVLNKKKLKELQEIAGENNINIKKLKSGTSKGFKNKTKKELILEIMNL